jgi:hypothetical protein
MAPPGASAAPSPRDADAALITRLLAVISGQAPMAEAEQLLAPDVISHMDRWTVRGTDVWYDWLEFIRSKTTEGVTAELDRMVTNENGTITAYGALRAAGAPLSGRQEHHATYRLENGRIAEVWTTRGNYEMIFGPKVRHPVRWLLVLVEMAIWRRLPWRSRALIPPRRRPA